MHAILLAITLMAVQPAAGGDRAHGSAAGITLAPAQPDGAAPVPTGGPAPRLPAPRAMSLQEALEYSRAHQPSLLAARARLSAVRADARVPGALYLPRVAIAAEGFAATANNSTAAYLSAPGVDLPRIGATRTGTSSWTPEPSTLAALGVRQEVFDFGRIGALQALADAQLEAEQGRLDAARLDLDLAVENAYFGVAATKRLRDAAAAASERARANRDTAAAGVRAGLRPPVDLTRAEADLSRFEVARVDAEQNVVAAQAAFAAVVGVSDRTLDAATAQEPVIPPAPSLDAAIDQALQRDPLVRERAGSVAAQRAATRAIAAEIRPDLSLTATLSGRAGGAASTSGPAPAGDGLLPSVPNWDVGLLFTWPLFDGGVRARAEASRAREEARQLEVDEARQMLGARVERVYVEYDAARQALPALEKSLTAARDNYAQALARFQAGLGTTLELADAQSLLAEADSAAAVGGFRLATARARLGRAIAENL